jgi:SAM-dependent methyltransferase
MANVESDQPLRETFNEDAELYDRMRPGYPDAMYDDLVDAIGPAGARVLEIGPGTGQATVSLAERGYRVVAVELGADLAAVARRNVARFATEDGPAVEVVMAAFEDWSLPEEPFDAVFSATAFHWIDPAVRVVKSADALRPGGVLATVGTHHIEGGSLEFFPAVQHCYERFDPATPPGLRPEPADAIPRDDAELLVSGRFGPASFHRYEWDQSYSTQEYLALLMTYSGHRALPTPAREGLLACIGNLIDHGHGGRIVKRYLTELRLARTLGG